MNYLVSMPSPWTKNLCNILTYDLSLIMGFSLQEKVKVK